MKATEEAIDLARDLRQSKIFAGDAETVALDLAEALVEVAEACVFGLPCTRHNGVVHGAEAEELRRGIEKILRDFDTSELRDPPRVESAMLRELEQLLVEVDARDSLAFVERNSP